MFLQKQIFKALRNLVSASSTKRNELLHSYVSHLYSLENLIQISVYVLVCILTDFQTNFQRKSKMTHSKVG